MRLAQVKLQSVCFSKGVSREQNYLSDWSSCRRRRGRFVARIALTLQNTFACPTAGLAMQFGHAKRPPPFRLSAA